MTAPRQIITRLRGRDSEGTPSLTTVPCRVGRVRRSVGLQPDRVSVAVKRGSIPVEWDARQTIDLEIGDTDGVTENIITLGGYLARRRVGGEYGQIVGEPTPDFTATVLLLETITGEMMDGRGGLLTAGTLNPLTADGVPDEADDRYRSNQELAEIALTALGVPFDAVPAAIDTAIDGVTAVPPPGPLDWGLCRALPELDSLLARLGWTATLRIDGSALRVHRLKRAGETVSLPAAITDHAEPFDLGTDRSVRGTTIVVTSGRTRTTIVTSRHLGGDRPLEWVAFDTRTGAWLNNSEWTTLYSGESAPIDIAAWRAGPGGDTEAMQRWSRMYTALRLTGDDLVHAARFQPPARDVTPEGEETFGRTGVVGHAKCCYAATQNQLQNMPAASEDPPVRLDGVRALAGHGVFVLPPGAFYVRLDPGPAGTYVNARALAGTEMSVVFAHEADTGDVLNDYFVSVWQVVETAGVLSVQRVTEEVDVLAALADPETVKLEAPYLRRIMWWPLDAGDLHADGPFELNDDDLHGVAETLALLRIGGASLQSGTVEMRGLHAIEPGDADGAVSAVEWDVRAARTIVHVNTHEAPYSEFDAVQAAARRSLAAGLGRVSLPGSSAALSDVRLGSTPGDASGGGGGGSKGAEAGSGSRGRDNAMVRDGSVGGDAPAPGNGSLRSADVARMNARITGSEAVGGTGHVWAYTWEEVYWDGSDWVHDVGARTGTARNRAEHGNPASGVLMIGIDTANLTGTFALQPIPNGRVVEIDGPYGGSTWWFSAENHVDGGCGEEVTFT
ncbi:MAG: hypothetical protein BroJett004_07890 [Planctomycetota bacterium]|nr:MAG: hypothetical protein BroJett004_07890 [Planctomycetota bacterium]